MEADPALKSDAKTELAWRYGRPYHVILHAREGANSHLVAHEFAHILLDEALRAEGVNKLFADNEETRRRALGALDKDVRKIQARRKLPAGDMARLVDGMLQSLTSQLFNTPLDLFIERRMFGEFPALRDAQFVDLARQMADNARIAAEPQARELIPQRLLQANLAMGAAFALFVDDLFGGATAYAAAYQATGMLPTGRKLYTLFQAAAAGGQPGAEYALVDAWADELRLRDWYIWRADTAACRIPPPPPLRSPPTKSPPPATAPRSRPLPCTKAAPPTPTISPTPPCRWPPPCTCSRRSAATAVSPPTRSRPSPSRSPSSA